MRHLLSLVVVGALVGSGCGSGGGGDGRHFDGTFGSVWEPLDDSSSDFGSPGFTDYTPNGQTGFYAMQAESAAVFTPAGGWVDVADPPADLDDWPGAAWVGDSLYVIRNGAVYAFDTVGGTWSTPVPSGVAATVEAQMTHDDDGHVYAVETDAPYRMVRYTIASNTVDYLDTGSFDGAPVFEPRIAWDSTTRLLYVAPAYNSPLLFSFDPDSPGDTVELASAPAVGGGVGTGMGDPFCGDRSGHLYAIGDTGCDDSASVFQYDIRSDTWRPLPDLPESHGCNGAATVSHDGWLYLAPGDTLALYRIRLH